MISNMNKAPRNPRRLTRRIINSKKWEMKHGVMGNVMVFEFYVTGYKAMMLAKRKINR